MLTFLGVSVGGENLFAKFMEWVPHWYNEDCDGVLNHKELIQMRETFRRSYQSFAAGDPPLELRAGTKSFNLSW